MVGEWREQSLSELCTYLNRGAAPLYVDSEGIRVVNQKCVRDQVIDFSHARRTNAGKKPISAERMLQRFDILVNSTGVGTLGRVAQIRELSEPTTVDSHVTVLRPNPAVVDPAYLGLAIRCFESEIEALGEGSTGQTELPRGRLAALRVPVPSRPEQRAIAHVIGALDDKIELNRRTSETLEATARALFKSWFVDFEPVRAKSDGRDLGLPASVADHFPARLVDSDVGEVPDGWPVLPLPRAIEVNPTRPLRRGQVAPYVDMANMPTRGHAVHNVVSREVGSGMRFVNGDTLVARITPCLENGKTALVDCLHDGQVGWGSTEYIVLRPKPPLPEAFAYCLARSSAFRDFAIQSMTGSSGRQRVPAESLGHFRLAVPPERVAREFGQRVAPLFARSSAAVAESRTLAALRDALLPKLMSGALRVPHAERLLAGAAV